MPWIMRQSWRDLLFAHWPVEAAALRPLVPRQLTLEEHGGSAWVGLTPFLMKGVRPRMLPPVPGASRFPEMNLRTYVRMSGRPGIWFFSLDAASRLAVLGARAIYRLPYFHARMEVVEEEGGWVRYRSRRRARPHERRAEFAGRYRPIGEIFEPEPGTLEHFLVERYALYAEPARGRVLRGEIHHRPWRLRPAEVEVERNTVPAAHGIGVSGRDPLLHFAARQDTLVWPPKRA